MGEDVRLSSRRRGHNPGALPGALAPGVDRPWSRSAARPGGGAELEFRWRPHRSPGTSAVSWQEAMS